MFIVLYIQRFGICLLIEGITCESFNCKIPFFTLLNCIYTLSVADKFLKIAAFLRASNQACFSSTESAYRIVVLLINTADNSKELRARMK